MANRMDTGSSSSSFSDPLSVHPWKALVDNICGNLDQDTFETFLYFSREALGEPKYQELKRNQNYVEYFSVLEDIFGETDALQHIELIVMKENLNLHGELGMKNFENEIKKYKESKKLFKKQLAYRNSEPK